MFTQRFNELAKAYKELQSTQKDGSAITETAAYSAWHQALVNVKEKRRFVYVVGNGGSAGLASHFQNDLIKALKIPAYTFYDSNLITCLANDYGYEHVFSTPLELMGHKDDVLIAISSSGKSPNILNAVQAAKKQQMTIITLSGFAADNPLRSTGDVNFYIPSHEYGLVEGAHFLILHTLVDYFSSFRDRS